MFNQTRDGALVVVRPSDQTVNHTNTDSPFLVLKTLKKFIRGQQGLRTDICVMPSCSFRYESWVVFIVDWDRADGSHPDLVRLVIGWELTHLSPTFQNSESHGPFYRLYTFTLVKPSFRRTCRTALPPRWPDGVKIRHLNQPFLMAGSCHVSPLRAHSSSAILNAPVSVSTLTMPSRLRLRATQRA